MYMLLLKDMLSFLGYLRFPTPPFIKNFITLGLEAVSPTKKKKKKKKAVKPQVSLTI